MNKPLPHLRHPFVAQSEADSRRLHRGCIPRMFKILCCGLVSLWLGSTMALAHKASDSYLSLRADDKLLAGEWHLSLRDLDFAIGLDTDDDGAITWQELRSHQSDIVAYALSRLQIRDANRTGQVQVTQMLVDNHSDGAYAVLRFKLNHLPHPTGLDVSYAALFDLDPSHRGLFRLETEGGVRSAVFSPSSPKQRFELSDPGPSNIGSAFIKEGIWHIWTGYDHLLFLVALLLPGVLQRVPAGWRPQASIASILNQVLKTVTSFTLAHSITLSLAALNLLHPPARLVESAIAASVILAALNNLFPLLTERGWMVAFAFGLIHGFGFANALADLGLRHGSLVSTLFTFNLGVEFGQLAIVALLLPVILLLRSRDFYRQYLLPAGSAAIVMVAATWFLERVLDIKWLPF